MSRILREDQWSRKWDCCQRCGTSEIPYYGGGLCKQCYFSARYKKQKTQCHCTDCGKEIGPQSTRCRSCEAKRKWEHGILGNEEWCYRQSEAMKAAWERGALDGFSEAMMAAWKRGAFDNRTTEEWCRKQSEAMKAAWTRGDFDSVPEAVQAAWACGVHDNQSEAMKAAWERGDYDGVFQSPTSIELQVAAALDILGIEHYSQYRPDGYSRIYDEYIPPATLIEVHGDYWHGDKRPDNQQRDAAKARWAADNGFDLIIIWEHEINKFGAWTLVMERIRRL